MNTTRSIPIARLLFAVAAMGLSPIWTGLLSVALAQKPATAPANRPATAPAEWRQVQVDKAFRLRLPPDVSELKVQGVDSLVRQWRGKSMALECDYGWYSDPLDYAARPKFQRVDAPVGGKNAAIITCEDEQKNAEFPLIVGIHFPNVTGDGKVKLTLVARCRDAEAAKVARQILETITFP